MSTHTAVPTDEATPDQATLTYPGHFDPEVGSLMGPGLDGRIWKVLGTAHQDGSSKVTLEALS